MRSIEPGISRFRVWSFGPSRNDGLWISSSPVLLAMTELGAVDPLDPEDCKTQDQQDQENHDKDVEQEAGDVRGRSRYAGEAEDAGNNRHRKEDQGPFQKRHRRCSNLEAPVAASLQNR